ncbi:transporter substrate-binding domain-containing protein [Cetobacterium sp. 8H]|uniref:transporter substrate-binding domain-containing protein n=1 Tax=Cetobacterium sp. 8H TaxID=2759681 RepID=UPI00163B7D67|nr:transporter substrate-binding domain-containing protein [Cetobacterium sp. 8H]MBC2850964.1 transporter substrate-binding domain-containing protein [Cetobacterium sp. 8H]
MKKIWICLMFLLGTFTFANEDTLIVGMELAYPPFEMSDLNGRPTGISVDMAYALGEYLGRDIIIEDMSYGGLIPALKTKKIDIIISSMSVTEERKNSVNFSKPYAKSYLGMLANKNSGIKEPMDLNQKGKKVAVKKGTSGHTVAEKYFPNAEILVFDKETACILEVSQGKVDAFIYDPLTIYRNWTRNQETTIPLLQQFETESQPWAIAYRKGEEDLGAQIDEFIVEYKNNDGFNKLADKYLGEERAFFKEKNVPFFFD